jgi:outer membrane immunogenic protein
VVVGSGMSGIARRQRLLAGVAGTAVIVSLGLNTPVKAQNAPIWTGFYLGGNAGIAWGTSHFTTMVDCSGPAGTGYFCNGTGAGAANAAALDASGTGDASDTGFTGGAQGGYNYQWGNALLGLEADFEAFDLNGSRTGSGAFPVASPTIGSFPAGTTYSITQTFNTDWLFTFRGRLGWTVQPNLLLYATGGLAVTELKIAYVYSDSFGGSSSGSASSTKTGWTVGGGVEWAFNTHWTVRAEYLYLDFGKVTATGNVPSVAAKAGAQNALSTTGDLTASIARLGVNYRF